MSYRYSFRVRKAQLAASVAFSLSILVSASRVDAATSGANGTHDPSRMIASDGKFYVYSTGGGSKSSTDGLVWANGPALFPGGIPQSGTSVVSNNEGVWAPDVIYLNNQYYIYYALANAQNACAVGLETTPTLDPTSPNYKLTDRGVVVSNTGSVTYCAIDPCPVLDASGNLWLSFGSGYSKSSTDNTIYVMRLDNTTGLASSATAAPGSPLEPGHIEASYIYYHTGYYYLFWNSGGCCSGASSTYEIHMARSQVITGPYTGSQIFLQSAGSVHGPGQIGIYDQCGADRFTYHYYPDTGGSVLGENELSWGSDGWPVAGASSTAPLTACAPTGGMVADAGSAEASVEDAGSGSAEAEAPPEDAGTDDDATAGSTEADSGGDSGGTGSMTGTTDDSGTGSRHDGGASTVPPGGGPTNTGGSSGGGCNVSGPQGQGGFAGLGLLAGLSLWAARRKRRHEAGRRG